MRVLAVHAFAGHLGVALRDLGAELVAWVEPGGFGADSVEANRAAMGFDGPIVTRPEALYAPDGIDAVLGNPPCRAFSVMNQSGDRGAGAAVNDAMWTFVRSAAAVNGGRGPDVAAFESVQGAYTRGRHLMHQLHEELEALTGERYALTHVLMSGGSVGAAQLRHRYFWVASRVPFAVDPPPIPSRVVTCEEAAGDLASLPLSREAQPYWAEPSGWARGLVSPTGTVGMHCHGGTSMERKMTALAIEGDWPVGRHDKDVLAALLRARGWDGEDSEKARALAPEGWAGVDVAKWAASDRFNVTWRLAGDAPARVVHGGGAAFFVHWSEDRTLTMREMARLMGLPDDWRLDYASAGRVYEHLGMNVPVQSWAWLAGWVQACLSDRPGAWSGEPQDDGSRVIDVTHDYKVVYDPLRRIHGVDARSAAWARAMDRRLAPLGEDDRVPRPARDRPVRSSGRAVPAEPTLVLSGEKLAAVVEMLGVVPPQALDAWTEGPDLLVLRGPLSDPEDREVYDHAEERPAWWGAERRVFRFAGAAEGRPAMGRGLVEVAARGIPFLVHPETTDEKAVAEVVVDDVYLRRLPGRVEPGETWLDLGGNIGAFSLWAAAGGAGRVVAYEPHPENAALLRRNAEGAGYGDRITVVEAAVAADPGSGTAPLYVMSAERSRYRHQLKPTRGRGSVEVEVHGAHELLRALRPDGVKMDIEGAELGILDLDLDWRTLGVRKLVLEYHFHADRSPDHFAERVERLRRGFDEVWTSPAPLPVADGEVRMFPDGRIVAAWSR